jgi:DNA-binding CsgD family transcriptional regulator
MTGPAANQSGEKLILGKFLRSAEIGPAALVIEGAAGIGKTTFWLSAVGHLRDNGSRILSARPAAAESVMAYASLADMLVDCDYSMHFDLPGPQRRALDRVLLRSDDDTATDQRAVGAAVLSVLTALSDDSPVVLAIDDLQWLDTSSRHIIAYVARRLPARVSVMVTVRVEDAHAAPASWLTLPQPDAMHRVRMRTMSLGALQKVLAARLGRTFPRPAMVSIHEISGGNPLYALELARATDSGRVDSQTPLPATLSELVDAKIGGIDDEVRETLLAAASHGVPTVELIARATSSTFKRVVEQLDDAEAKGIITLEGSRLRFTHPLLAKGVYVGATPAQRRAMHRRLAEVVDEPELHAWHLAFAATIGDRVTLTALDAAAASARLRGAPAAAAQLLERALKLGGDAPERRMALAGDHFRAGDLVRSRVLLEEAVQQLAFGHLRATAKYALGRLRLVVDSFGDAIDIFKQSQEEAGDDHALKAQSLLAQSFALMNTRQLPAAIRAAEDSAAKAERTGSAELLGQGLAFLCGLRVMAGEGLDEANLRRALDLGDATTSAPVQFRPAMINALMLAWTGRLHESHQALRAVRKRCMERGEESELMFVAFHGVLIEVWRGEFSEAALIAEDSMERAIQLGGEMPLVVALSNRCIAAGYAGRTAEAEADALEAIRMAECFGYHRLTEWPRWILGFVSVSVGDYERALTVLSPLVAQIEEMPRATEMFVGSSLPDAAEAMIHIGRLAEAERLVEMLESNGARLDRPWMLAVGARTRAMLLAARGDLDGAARAAQSALAHHERVPMPFDRARTQLLCGQLLRRRRQKDAAAAAFVDALTEFDRMGAVVWADRAQSELSRAKVSRLRPGSLTPSELQVARLAASGMRNRDIGTELFISPKTVEANLSRIYRKLGIRSRVELFSALSSEVDS